MIKINMKTLHFLMLSFIIFFLYSFINQNNILPDINLKNPLKLKDKNYYNTIFNENDINSLNSAYSKYTDADKYFDKYLILLLLVV